MTTTTTAQACANIALVKYWGKRDHERNIPAAGSLSLTLDKLRTTTSVCFDETLAFDEFTLDGARANPKRLTPWLDIVRKRAHLPTRARVVSRNNFPTSSGLASSSSAFAALALAATHAAGLRLSRPDLSELARRGSGSAARSIFGGFAQMVSGTDPNGSDSIASQISPAEDWPICMVIAIVGSGAAKSVSSRDAMNHCATTSPLYQAWLATVPDDLSAAMNAIHSRDLHQLGTIAECSAMAMHAAALASRPPIRYWQPATLTCLNCVQDLRNRGIHAYPTMDAGPHVKVLTTTDDCHAIANALRNLEDVSDVIISSPGPHAALV